MLPNKTYDTLKWIAQYLLPALGSLYFGLSSIWNFPYAEEIVGSIMALDTFLGALLGISTLQYKATKYVQPSLLNIDKIETFQSFFILPEKVYTILTWVTQVVMPALGTLYVGLAALWGFPYGEQVVGSIAVIDVFLGVLLGYLKSQYDEASKKTSEESELEPES